MKKIFSIVLLFLVFSQSSYARRVYVRKANIVNPTASDSTFTTIAAGLSSSYLTNGDTVIIYEGTYPEKINFRHTGTFKKLVIGSQYLIDGDKSHIAKTIIDASDISQTNEWDDAIIANYTSTSNPKDVQVVGITLTSAKRFGLYMYGGIVKACIFKDNGTGYGYNFMWVNNTIIDSCTFENNKSGNLIVAQSYNGWNAHAKTIIKNSVFKNNLQNTNSDGGLIFFGYSQDVFVQNSLFYKNAGGNIFTFGGEGGNTGTSAVNNDSAFISNCLVYNNKATVGMFKTWERRDGGTFYFINNIIDKNDGSASFSGTEYFNYRGGENSYTYGFFNNYIPLDMSRAKQNNLSSSSNYYARNNYDASNKIIFKDSANGDYHLADSSYGFSLGIDTLKLDTVFVVAQKDFDGVSRPSPVGSKIDLGPFENSNAVAVPILTKATAGNGKVYLNWKVNQSTYDSILVYRSTDSLGTNYDKIGAKVKPETVVTTVSGQINNEVNYIDLGTYGNSRYYLSKARKSWTNSRSSAKADGADLIVFESKAEFDFVMN
ncbi:MAG: hypothetical protein RL634_2085, partial [Bacteroidota bacterium]